MTKKNNDSTKIGVDDEDVKIAKDRPRESLYKEPDSKGKSESHNTTTSHCPDNWGSE